MSLVKVQYRHVFNDANVSEWKDWAELGTFESLDQAIASLSLEFSGCALQDVSFNQIGVYQVIDCPASAFWQLRFPSTVVRVARTVREHESPWKVGLNEA
jgi:hypothetical protein